MELQPIPVRASTIAAEVAVTIMRAAALAPELRDSAAHLATFLQSGPHDLVAAISEATVARIQSEAAHA